MDDDGYVVCQITRLETFRSSLQDLTAEGFRKWKRQYELYRIASGADKRDEAIQVALLLHCLSEAFLDICNTFRVSSQDEKYTLITERFENHFTPQENLSVKSHIFLRETKKI